MICMNINLAVVSRYISTLYDHHMRLGVNRVQNFGKSEVLKQRNSGDGQNNKPIQVNT